MYVVDMNGDGRPDVLTSMAHDYGIFWLEHKADGSWEKHVIDDSWSQPHAMTLVDFRGTGNLGILTGKRYMAHNGHDPGSHEPLGVYWYERMMIPGSNKVEWARHLIDYGGRTGGGIQIPVADIDGDGQSDIVVRGKDGLHSWRLVKGAWIETGALPSLSDANGWDQPSFYQTIQFAHLQEGSRQSD